MNKLLCTLIAATFSLSSYSAFAGNNSTNTEDAQEGLVQDETATTSTGSSGKTSDKNMKHKSGKSANNMDHNKMMDKNSDGMISREEYMSHHEMAYSKMKQTNGSVSMKEMDAQMKLGTTKGNKIQPSNTKDTAPTASN